MSKRSKPGVDFLINNLVEGNSGKIHLSIFNVRYNLGSKKNIRHLEGFYCCAQKR